MPKKKKSSFVSTFFNLLVGVPALLGIITRLGSLIGYETRLAGKSLISILMLALISAMLITTTWLCLLAILYVYLSSLLWSPLAIFGILLAINLVFLIIICIMICHCKKTLSFPDTRLMIQDACSLYKDL